MKDFVHGNLLGAALGFLGENHRHDANLNSGSGFSMDTA